jgi:heterodisulfide reductase subunit B
VLYNPQILGLAMGFSMDEMGLKLNRVKPRELVRKLRETEDVRTASHGEEVSN